jgi:hypothetical protein
MRPNSPLKFLECRIPGRKGVWKDRLGVNRTLMLSAANGGGDGIMAVSVPEAGVCCLGSSFG